MALKVRIRKFRFGDEFAVVRIIRDANRITLKKFYSPSVIKQMCVNTTAAKIRKKGKEKNLVVAIIGNKIVGVVGLTQNRPRSFFVHPRHQGKGIGRMLIQSIEKKAKKLKMKFLKLNSSLFAVSFYKHFGYKVIKRLKPNKTNGPGFEVVLMKKNLIKS